MALVADNIDPKFTNSVKGRICEHVIKSSKNAIEQLYNRDQDFLTWAQQAEGDPFWAAMQPRWRGACDIEDPITDEHLLETVSSMTYVLRQPDWFSVSETDDGDENAASGIEAYMNDVVVEAKLNTQHLYDLVYNSTRYGYGCLHLGWKQQVTKQYQPVMRHKVSKRIAPMNAPEVLSKPDDYSLTEEITENLDHDGFFARVPYTGDIYLDNPASQSFKDASRVIERFEYSEDDLLNGIEDFGFDEDMTHHLLSQGPVEDSDRTYQRERNDIEGVNSEPNTWEVFMVTGKAPPLLEGGIPSIKSSERERDYQWMICPAHNICFKFAVSPYHRRPYAKFPFRGRPGRMGGHGVCSMLAPLQQEASLAFRFRVDFRDLYMSSPLLVPEGRYDDLQRYKLYAGAMIPYPETGPMAGPQSIQPLPYNPAGFQAGMEDNQFTLGRADALFSADARGPASTVQRTATQSRQAGAGADEKLDLFLMNFQFGMQDTGEIILSHAQQFAVADGPFARKIGQQTVELSPEMLRKRFRITVSGSSENSDPAIRLDKAKLLHEIASADPILMQNFQSGDKTGVYWVMSHLYRAMGIKNPAVIDGPMPSAPPNADYVLQTVAQIAMQYAQSNDPAALAILTAIQQLQASGQGQQQQGQQGAGPGTGAPKMSINMAFKDAPPGIQTQIEQAMGFQPVQPSEGVNTAGHIANKNGKTPQAGISR